MSARFTAVMTNAEATVLFSDLRERKYNPTTKSPTIHSSAGKLMALSKVPATPR